MPRPMNQPPDCLLFEFPNEVWLLYDFQKKEYGGCFFNDGLDTEKDTEPKTGLFAFATPEEADQVAALFEGMTMIPVLVPFDEARVIVKNGDNSKFVAIAFWQDNGDPIIHYVM